MSIVVGKFAAELCRRSFALVVNKPKTIFVRLHKNRVGYACNLLYLLNYSVAVQTETQND